MLPPTQVFVGEHVPSVQSFGFVNRPGMLHAPPPAHCELLVHVLPGHCDATVHAAPTLVPPAHVRLHALPLLLPPVQRRPPQTLPAPVQSALLLHGSAAKSLQVLQRHFKVPKPGAVQLGFAADTVRVSVPVELLRLIGSAATTAPETGGQSRLVLPQNRFIELPFTSHVRPAFGPTSQVPPRLPSFGVVSPTHFGHGFGFGPVETREINWTCDAALPVVTFAVPVIEPFTWLPTHVATPPAASGRYVPK